MLRILIFLTCLILALPATAACTFKTGNHINELRNPQHILGISITVPKSSKYQVNLLKTMLAKTTSIPNDLKKKFKASVVVSYPFGNCTYSGRIRQSGDWKDHINFTQNGSNIVRSLDVKLDNGNILNSVRFKLLLPETRNDLKEIFALSILDTLDFLTPETFKVKVSVNGVITPMLFQETARKELLERRSRREGPIFEGDETILWGNGRLLNDDLSLTVMENTNWFLRGESSEYITLKAYDLLQAAYILRGNHSSKFGSYVDPNKLLTSKLKPTNSFPQFHFLMQSLIAEHGLIFHNRKFYYNVFEGAYEPIYYDGDVGIATDTFDTYDTNILKNAYYDLDTEQFLSKILSSDTQLKAQNYFHKRTDLTNEKSSLVFTKYWSMFAQSAKHLNYEINKTKLDDYSPINLTRDEINSFTARAKNNSYINELGTKLFRISASNYRLDRHNQKPIFVGADDLASIIGENQLKGNRLTLLSDPATLISNIYTTEEFLGGKIKTSEGIITTIDYERKEMVFTQQNADDWVLMTGVDLKGWKITFTGLTKQISTKKPQRFNEAGMTGCLNFYKSTFKDVELNVQNGSCEDSLNIVWSSGSIKTLTIQNAYADAIDMDFSVVSISDALVKNAQNDCVDVSGGRYEIETILLDKCGDKGLSVGEGSYLSAKTLQLTAANIGISSKDLSEVEIDNATISNTAICVESKQKKQEFGGAIAELEKIRCTGRFEIDEQSLVKVGGNEL